MPTGSTPTRPANLPANDGEQPLTIEREAARQHVTSGRPLDSAAARHAFLPNALSPGSAHSGGERAMDRSLSEPAMPRPASTPHGWIITNLQVVLRGARLEMHASDLEGKAREYRG